jgi:hypothetical protein
VRRYYFLDWHHCSSFEMCKRNGRESFSLPIASSCTKCKRIDTRRTSSKWITKPECNQQRKRTNKLTYRWCKSTKCWMGNPWCRGSGGSCVALSESRIVLVAVVLDSSIQYVDFTILCMSASYWITCRKSRRSRNGQLGHICRACLVHGVNRESQRH